MNMHSSSPRRGAARHWILGCLAILVILVVIFVGGGYYMYRQVAPGTFDVASKTDPALSATPDVLFPAEVGGYQRTTLTTPDTAAGDQITTGLKAIYQKGSTSEDVTIFAVPTDSFQQARAGAGRGNPQASVAPGQLNMGVTAKIPFGPTKGEIALWQKENWTYMIQTTSTSALEFAKAFSPATDDSSTTAP